MPQKSTRTGLQINQFVLGGFSIVIVLSFITAIATYMTTRALQQTSDLVAKTQETKSLIRRLERKIVDAETEQRGFLIANRAEYLEPYNTTVAELDNSFAELEVFLSNSPEQLARLNDVEILVWEKVENMQQTIALKQSGQGQEALNLFLTGQGRMMMDNIRAKLAEMEEFEETLLEDRRQQAAWTRQQAALLNWGSFALIAAVAAIVSWIITRQLTRSLNESLQFAVGVAESVADGDLTVNVEGEGDDEIGRLMSVLKGMTHRLTELVGGVKRSGIEVGSSATQIAASGKQLEVTMREQSATTQETTVAAKEIASTAQSLATTMDEVSSLARSTTHAAAESQADLNSMEDTIRQLVQATNGIATRLGAISEKANNINTVVTTITKVADQTNLLSLNAAIEAEKAGEYGAGFSVVAREIRRLADRTAVATLEIESMVKEMQSSVSTGVMEMDKFSMEVSQSVDVVAKISDQVGEIIRQVQELSPRFDTVNEGMDAQVQGAQQISEAMVQLNEVSVQTNNSFEDINGALNQLNLAAQRLQKEIGRFKVSDRVSAANS